jgi:hypothetical protein
MLPNTYIRSVIAKEPIKTFTEEELKSKSALQLQQIEDYQIKSLKLLAGDQVLNVIHNINLIDKLTDKKRKS